MHNNNFFPSASKKRDDRGHLSIQFLKRGHTTHAQKTRFFFHRTKASPKDLST